MIALSCSTTPVPVPETPTKISHPSLDMSSPLSEGIINQYDVWQFLKQKPEESEVFDLLGNKVMELTGNTINMENLSSATYIVNALDLETQESLSYKIIKK